MKTNLPSLLRGVLSILILAGCGAALDVRADVQASVADNVLCYHNNGDGNGAIYDYNGAFGTNATFHVKDSVKWAGYFNGGSTGAYAYYDLERNFDGTNVTHVMHVASAQIDAPFVDSFEASSMGAGELQIIEDMKVVYFPASATDTPPTSVSFQVSYSVQGQFFLQYSGGGTNTFNVVTAAPDVSGGDNFRVYGGAGVSTPISDQILSQTFTYAPNEPFQLNLDLQANGGGWDNSVSDKAASTVDVRLILNGFANVVDQNSQPIPLGKLGFYYVNPNAPNDPTQQIAIPNPTNLTVVQPITLDVGSGTNGLVLQWPAYASNYQLETTTNLVNPSWTTNSLPPPVVSGPFLQVTVPTTNAAAFFRLQSQ